jgi:hypothetical protein
MRSTVSRPVRRFRWTEPSRTARPARVPIQCCLRDDRDCARFLAPDQGGSDHLIAAASPRQRDSLNFSRPIPNGIGRPDSLDPEGFGGWRDDAQAGMPSDEPRAQLAFKDSMIRGILQFTLRIAFRCVLHRCKSQDIRC